MGVRPPDDDDLDGPDVVEFGIPALEDRIDTPSLSYPVTTETLRREYGDVEVPYDATGRTVRLAKALDDVGADRFESERALLNAFHPVFEQYRESSSRDYLSQLRSLVPF